MVGPQSKAGGPRATMRNARVGGNFRRMIDRTFSLASLLAFQREFHQL
jgi:hypothetical protein